MKKTIGFILLLLPFFVLAQSTIKGTVTDNTNFPLPGASVVVKGTTKGVVTDIDGKYEITVKETPATLSFSFLGFISQEVEVNESKTINISLQEDKQVLEEVVVIGYGQVEKGDLTGSVTSVKPKKDIVNQARNVENLLQGQAAGVLVQQNSAEPGATSSIKIRGINSLTGNTEPLYVIDGIIVDSATEDVLDPLQGGNSSISAQNGISGINPRDIESIEVLKDASATAIYGSRGANGVIIITTKKGEKGDAKFTYSTTTSISEVSKKIDVLNTKDFVNYQNDFRASLGFQPYFYTYPDGSIAQFQGSEQNMIDNADQFVRLEEVNWQDEIFRTGYSSSHRLTASGGNENSDYYLALGYNDIEGIIPNATAQIADLNLKYNTNLNERFKLNSKIAASFSKFSASKGTERGSQGNNPNMVFSLINFRPFANYEELGTDIDNNDEDATAGAPQDWVNDYDDLSREIRVLGASTLDYKISKVFNYNVRVGVDYRAKERKVWNGTSLFRGRQANGEAGISNLSRFRYNIDNTLRFNKRFNKIHRINGTVGAIIDQRFIQQQANTGTGFALKDLRADGLSTAQVTQPTVFYKEQESLMSYLARFNYSFKNRYLFTATYRADGSSRFAQGNQWGHFPAVALAWKIHQEKFLRKSKLISEAKLRAGWGLTGNQAIPSYRFYQLYTGAGLNPYGGENGAENGVNPAFLQNENLKWETSSQYNVGLDLGLWENKTNLTFDVFYKTVDDLLLNQRIPPSNGFDSYYVNQGSLVNKGIEIGLNTDIISNENFKWNVYGNISIIRNEITNLGIPPSQFGTETYSAYLGNQISGGAFFKVPANIFIDGEAPGLFYGYETNGIVSNAEDLANAPTLGSNPVELGDVFLVDQNGDGIITAEDRTIIGDPNPDFSYGFGSSVEYKNLSLSFFFNGVYGNDIANGSLLRQSYASGRNLQNIRKEAYFDAWSPANPTGQYPRVGYDSEGETDFTDRLVEDGSFLRLNNVSLGYNVPVSKNAFFKNIYFSISGQNLWLITDYSGFDPEVNSFAYDPSRVGVDWNSFPNQKSYTASLNLTF